MEAIREVLAVPFGYLLYIFYSFTNSYVFSIVLITLLVRICMLPVSAKQQRNSAKQVRLNTKVNKIKAKYAGNQQKIQEETQALYQREGFSAANFGCAPLLIQMVVMIGLYGVIVQPLTSILRFKDTTIEAIKGVMNLAVSTGKAGGDFYAQIKILDGFQEFGDVLLSKGILTADQISAMTTLQSKYTVFGLELSGQPDIKKLNALWIIPVLAFATAMLSSVFMYIKQRQQNPEMAKNPSMGCMTFMSPVMSLVWTFMFPAGVGFYWIISNVISFLQQLVLTSVYSPKKVIAQQMVEETVVRRSKENNTKLRVENEKK